MKEIIFNEKDHSYEVDGITRESITQWLSRVGISDLKKFNKEWLGKRAETGRKVHKILEKKMGGEFADPDKIEDDVFPYIVSADKFLTDNPLKPLFIEKKVYYDFGDTIICCTTDLVATSKNTGDIVLLDWKTSAGGKCYASTLIQLMFNAIAIESCCKIKINKILAVVLDKQKEHPTIWQVENEGRDLVIEFIKDAVANKPDGIVERTNELFKKYMRKLYLPPKEELLSLRESEQSKIDTIVTQMSDLKGHYEKYLDLDKKLKDLIAAQKGIVQSQGYAYQSKLTISTKYSVPKSVKEQYANGTKISSRLYVNKIDQI